MTNNNFVRLRTNSVHVNTGNEPTDLREAFTLYDLRGGWANTHDKEIILRQINKKVRKDYIPKSEVKDVLNNLGDYPDSRCGASEAWAELFPKEK